MATGMPTQTFLKTRGNARMVDVKPFEELELCVPDELPAAQIRQPD
jgi:hypothetical protein